MKKIKFLVTIVLGGLAGSGITYVLLKEIFAKQAQDDIDDVRAWAVQKIDDNELRLMADIALLKAQVKYLGGNVDDEEEEAEEEAVEEAKDGKSRISYHKMAKSYGTQENKADIETVLRERNLRSKANPVDEAVFLDDHPEEDMDEEDNEEDDPTVPVEELLQETANGPDIRLITFKEFSNDMEHYDKLTLTYYEGDDILTDDKDGQVPNPREIVGSMALRSFDSPDEDPNVVYVRNNKKQCDFEICRNFGYFSEDVLGVSPDYNPKRKKIAAPADKPKLKEQEPKRTVKPRVKKAAKDGQE